MRELCLPEDLHPGQTGPERSDRSRAVRPVQSGQTGPETGQTGLKCLVRVRSCILTRDLIGFRLLTGTDLPTLYI